MVIFFNGPLDRPFWETVALESLLESKKGFFVAQLISSPRYGVTKAAFHRLYQQLNAEDLGVPVASLSPGRPGKWPDDGCTKHPPKKR